MVIRIRTVNILYSFYSLFSFLSPHQLKWCGGSLIKDSLKRSGLDVGQIKSTRFHTVKGQRSSCFTRLEWVLEWKFAFIVSSHFALSYICQLSSCLNCLHFSVPSLVGFHSFLPPCVSTLFWLPISGVSHNCGWPRIGNIWFLPNAPVSCVQKSIQGSLNFPLSPHCGSWVFFFCFFFAEVLYRSIYFEMVPIINLPPELHFGSTSCTHGNLMKELVWQSCKTILQIAFHGVALLLLSIKLWSNLIFKSLPELQPDPSPHSPVCQLANEHSCAKQTCCFC